MLFSIVLRQKIGAVPATFVGRLHVDIPQLLWNSRGDDRTPAVGGDSWFTLFDGSGELRLAWMLIDTAPSTPIPSPSAWFAAVCAKAAAALQDESRSTAQHPLFLDGHGLVVKPELLPSWLVGQSHWLAVQEGSKFKMDSEGLLNRPKPDVDSSLDNCRGAVSEPVVTTEDRSALSKLLRHGGCIPEEFRHWLWPALASTPTSSAKLPLYPALIQQYKDADDQQQENVAIKDLKGQIALDIPRTFPFQRTCVNTTAGEEALERIVGAITTLYSCIRQTEETIGSIQYAPAVFLNRFLRIIQQTSRIQPVYESYCWAPVVCVGSAR
eukprot:SAG31_NODE_1931_length_6880_cov_6.530010_4_plen_325_part_00